MRLRSVVVAATLAVLALPAATSASSSGTHEQIAWVRRAAARFVTAELHHDGAGACAVLNADLRATQRHQTCEQRWDARLTRALRERGVRAKLGADARAIPTASVSVHGNVAWIQLPTALLAGESRFVWSEMCWMLDR